MPRNHIGGKRHATSGDASGVWYANEVLDEMLEGNWPNKLEVKVGSFAKATSTGTQTVSGVGFIPKAVIFFTSGSDVASGTWDTGGVFQCIGFTAGPNESYAVSGRSNDGQLTSRTARRIAAAAMTLPDIDGSTVTYEASLDSFTGDGFVLDWSSNSAGAHVVGYIALGGDIEAEVLNWQSPTSTGNKVVNTGTFQPDLVFHMSTVQTALGSGTLMALGLGAMNASAEQWAVSVSSADGVTTSDTRRYQRTDKAVHVVRADADFPAEQASFVSMDAAGFTVNFDTVAGSARQYASLCIKGVQSKLGHWDKATSAAPVTDSITDPGWRPKVLLSANLSLTTQTTPTSSAIMGLGATDGTNERVVAQVDFDGVSTTEADSIWKNDKTLIVPSNGPVINAEADVAFTDTGFDATWTTNNGVATRNLYAAIAAK